MTATGCLTRLPWEFHAASHAHRHVTAMLFGMNNDDLTVMTYNVSYSLAGEPGPIVDAILQGDAHLVFLQETNLIWEDALRRALAPRYPFIELQHSARRSGGGLGVLSRLPIEECQISSSPVDGFPACRVVVKTAMHGMHESVQVLNVHLYPPFINGSLLRGCLRTPALRRREIEHHLRALDRNLPTFVVGDFNEQDCGKAVRSLVKTFVVRSALSTFDRRATTWRWPVGPFTLRQRLDHVFYDTRAFRCVGARVVDAGTSDHLPVVGRFRRRRGPSAL